MKDGDDNSIQEHEGDKTVDDLRRGLLGPVAAPRHDADVDNFRHLAEALPHLVWTAEANGRFDYIGPQFSRLCGLEVSEVDQSDWERRIHPEDQAAAMDAWWECVRSSQTYEAEFRIETEEGNFPWFRARAVPVCRAATGQIVKWYGVATEIHEHKQGQLLLQELGRQKDEFIAVLSHELRNPLAAMVSGFNTLTAPGAEDAQRVEAVEIMGRQLKHLARLADDIRDVAELDFGSVKLRTEKFDGRTILNRCRQEFMQAAEQKGIRFECVPDASVLIEADRFRTWQAVSNLVANALQFTPRGGTVRFGMRAEGEEAVFEVHDSGLGIEPEEQERILAPFSRGTAAARTQVDGLGLGLFLVRRMVEMQRGSVEVASAGRDRGSSFVLRLPLAEGSADQALKENTGTPAHGAEAPKSGKILIVEDNDSVGQSLKIFLEIEGHKVELVTTGTEALDRLDQSDYDLVFCDISLGQSMDGTEVIRSFLASSETGERPYLVALSGHASEKDAQRSLEAGFDRHVAKPPELEDLRSCVASALA